MTTEHLTRKMQEQLDGVLSEDQTEALFRQLSEDEEAAQAYAQLEQVANILTRAPHMRAPARLAVTIMARLAETVEAQAQLQNLPESTRQALMLSLSLVMISMMPVMLGSCWLVLNMSHNPELIDRAVNRTLMLMVLMIEAMVDLLSEIEHLLNERPADALAMLNVLPIALLGILEYIEDAFSEAAEMTLNDESSTDEASIDDLE